MRFDAGLMGSSAQMHLVDAADNFQNRAIVGLC